MAVADRTFPTGGARTWGSKILETAKTDQAPAKYPVSDLKDISTIIVSSDHGKQQLEALKQQGLRSIRHVRGDGNCFYRALGFCFLETLVAATAVYAHSSGIEICFGCRFGS